MKGQSMRLAHTMIRVRDLDASLEFYCDFLGLQEIRRKDLGEEATLVFLSDNSKNYHMECEVPKLVTNCIITPIFITC